MISCKWRRGWCSSPAAISALRDQVARPQEPQGAARLRRENSGEDLRTDAPHRVPTLEYFNGMGGFDSGAREYVVVLGDGQWTPAPWINVIANPQFGFLASADGSGSTWSLNAQQNQITPWCNDPVSDTPAEAIYVRDENSGDLWSATPLPIRERYLRLCCAAWFRLHAIGTHLPRHCIELDAVRAACRSDQDIAAEDPERLRRNRGSRRSPTTLDWVLGNQN